jgi:hypothetical protein
MSMQFINDDFLPRMFSRGTNDFREIKRKAHYMEEVGLTIELLGVETEDKYLVVLHGLNDAVSQEREGIYFFNDRNEADQFYQKMLREHLGSPGEK